MRRSCEHCGEEKSRNEMGSYSDLCLDCIEEMDAAQEARMRESGEWDRVLGAGYERSR